LITAGESERSRAVSQLRSRLGTRLQLAESENSQLLARVVSLSPQAVLNRGYAVLWNGDGGLIRDADLVTSGEKLQVRVAHGEFSVRVDAASMKDG
jgi:exodeoxyribonuclease VII large subunit